MQSSVEDLKFSTDWVTNYQESWGKNLGKYIGRAKAKHLEIGCFEGRSAIWFLTNILTHPSARLVVVDSFADYDREMRFNENMTKLGVWDKVVKLRGKSSQVLRQLPLYSFDSIYVDGGHDAFETFQDLALCWELLKYGGTMIVDDYGHPEISNERRCPRPAIDGFLECFASKIEVLEKGYQVIIKKKEPIL